MHRKLRVQMTAMLGVGVLFGYLAASGRLNPLSDAGAASPQVQGPKVKPPAPAENFGPACCSERSTKGELLALADPKAHASGQEGGKKPNILVIFGDDIGI